MFESQDCRIGPPGRLSDPSRRGFTWLEVMVVVSVIALLVALLLPAVMQSRATARGVVCQTRLRSLSLALTQYAGIHGNYPAMGRMPGDPNPHVSMLPFLEQRPLADLILSGGNFNGDAAVLVQAFQCPDDPLMQVPGTYPTAYGLNDGGGMLGGRGELGPFVFSGCSPAAIRDGFGSTAAFCEILGASPESRRLYWVEKDKSATPAVEAMRACDELSDESAVPVTSFWLGNHWILGSLMSVGYNHMLPPNRRSCVLQHPRRASIVSSILASLNAASPHAGLVNMATLDGAVRSVSDEIDADVWQALGTRAASDHVPSEF